MLDNRSGAKIMPIRVKVKGVREHVANTEKRRKKVHTAVTNAVIDWATLIENRAIWSVIEFGIPSPNHIVSLPHNPPNSDTFMLAESIHSEIRGEGVSQELTGGFYEQGDVSTVFTVDVLAGGGPVNYAVALEWGTSNMIERPFMLPASQERKAEGRALVEAAVKKAVQNG
jgi:hypothetical protein